MNSSMYFTCIPSVILQNICDVDRPSTLLGALSVDQRYLKKISLSLAESAHCMVLRNYDQNHLRR